MLKQKLNEKKERELELKGLIKKYQSELRKIKKEIEFLEMEVQKNEQIKLF